jgi:hypothetical protein
MIGGKVFKTVVAEKDGGSIRECDTIEHEGRLWLVPSWIDNRQAGYSSPAQIVGPAAHRFQAMGPGRYLLDGPVPRAVLDGQARPNTHAEYEVILRPTIRFSIPSES